MFDDTDLATKLVPSYKMSSQKLCTSYTADQYTRGVSKIKENEKCFRGRAQRLKTTDESDTAVYCSDDCNALLMSHFTTFWICLFAQRDRYTYGIGQLTGRKE